MDVVSSLNLFIDSRNLGSRDGVLIRYRYVHTEGKYR